MPHILEHTQSLAGVAFHAVGMDRACVPLYSLFFAFVALPIVGASARYRSREGCAILLYMCIPHTGHYTRSRRNPGLHHSHGPWHPVPGLLAAVCPGLPTRLLRCHVVQDGIERTAIPATISGSEGPAMAGLEHNWLSEQPP